MDSAFKDAIREHLQLKERNRWIEPTMPLSRYRAAAPPAERGVDLGRIPVAGTFSIRMGRRAGQPRRAWVSSARTVFGLVRLTAIGWIRPAQVDDQRPKL